MKVLISDDVMIETDEINHMNGLYGRSATGIHYKNGQSQIVEMKLERVVELINLARVAQSHTFKSQPEIHQWQDLTPQD